MPNHSSTSASPKSSKSSSSSSFSSSLTESRLVRRSQSQQPAKLQSRVRSKLNEFFHNYAGGQAKEPSSDKNKGYQKPIVKEPKPVEVKLHTQQRAVKRAGFNYLVECKMTMIEHQRQQEERFRKMIEEEEIKMLRREMVPRAQLMPLFNRPFFPQRSTRPLTVPKDPSFHSKSWRCMSSSEDYNFQRRSHQSSKVIK